MSHSEPGALAEELEELLIAAPGPGDTALVVRLADVRPEDIAEVLGDFAPDDRIRIFAAVAADRRAEVLKEVDPTTKSDIVQSLDPDALARIVGGMHPDDATDVVEIVPENTRADLLELLQPETASEVRGLLRFESESAGGIMTSEFIAVHPEESARGVLDILQQTLETEVVSYVYVIDDTNTLLGVSSIREIIAAQPTDAVRDFMQTEVLAANVGDDREDVANLARKYNLKSIPIVDSDGRLLGVATIDDIVDVISDEADEDIYRLAGNPSKHPVQQRILRRALVRTPWLLLSLASGFVIAYRGYQENASLASDSETTLLWAFVPLVIGLSGGVGTQSATLIARGLATGEIDMSRTFRVFGQEFAIGVSISLFMGLLVIGFLYTLDGWGVLDISARFPLGVGTGLAVGVFLATISGTLIPICCQAIRVDPALVAGPFVTSFNDVVGALSFMAIGKLLLN